MPEIYSEVCDSKWIIENVKKYKFDEADRVKQLIDFIKAQSDAAQQRLDGIDGGQKSVEILEAYEEIAPEPYTCFEMCQDCENGISLNNIEFTYASNR